MSAAMRRRARSRVTPGRVIAALGALVALLAGLTSLIDWVGAKATTPPPARVDSDIVWAKQQGERVTLADYLRENGKPTQGLTKDEAGELGLMFAVRVRLRGKPDTQVELGWRMFQRDGDPLSGALYNQRAGRFTTGSRDHAATVQVWVPSPPRRGSYSLRFSLRDEQRHALDFATAAFTATRIPT
jgi:hypothetical protein